MYEPRTIAEATSPQTATLAAIASTRRLVVCIGAGFSVAPPTELPSGKDLAKDVHARLQAQLGDELPACDNGDLTSVADAAATLPTGADLVRRTCLDIADFTTASPNYAHKTLAMLILEGFVSALSWNWDDCVERSGQGEHVFAVVTDQDRRDLNEPALLKLHGCASRPPTMLVTTEDLQQPRPWVQTEMAGRLADSVVAFVGIGDIAGYTRDQVLDVMNAVGDVSHVYVVSPGVVEHWDESMWSELVPALPDENRVPASAEEFVEGLAASMLAGLLAKLDASAAGHPPLMTAAQRVSTLVMHKPVLTVLRFGRASGVRVKPGTPCLSSNNGRRAVLAMGTLLPADHEVSLCETHLELDGSQVRLLISPEDRPAGEFAREARLRSVDARNAGHDGNLTFICAGALGPLPQGPVTDVIGTLDPDDIIAGAHAEHPVLLAASALLGAA